MTKELTGKIAFVTGSGRGLGRAMAERLAELGADVAIHDISWTAPAKFGEAPDLGAVAKAIARHGGKVAAVTGNIGDKAAVAKMKEEIEARLGHVDILVNCAGGDIGASGGKPDPNDALGIPLEDIRVLTENNLYGTILVCQAFVPPMVKAGSGSVINIASVAGVSGAPLMGPYGASKAGLISLTRTLAVEWGTAGVRVNALCPGWTATELNRTLWEDPHMGPATVAGSALKRWASAEEMAGPAVFLASDASSFMTGQTLIVDGGQTVTG